MHTCSLGMKDCTAGREAERQIQHRSKLHGTGLQEMLYVKRGRARSPAGQGRWGQLVHGFLRK